MAYKCPRCGDPVRRGAGGGGRFGGGLAGALLYAAFGSFQCAKCGKVPRKEFPPEDRKKMFRGSFAFAIAAIVLLAGAITAAVLLHQ